VSLDLVMAKGRIVWAEAAKLLAALPQETVSLVVSSPPYWRQRTYAEAAAWDGDVPLGMEATPWEYAERLGAIMQALVPALCARASLWLVIGDTYSGVPGGATGNHPSVHDAHGEPKRQVNKEWRAIKGLSRRGAALPPGCLVGVPQMVWDRLKWPEPGARSWLLRNEIIWNKGSSNFLPRQAHRLRSTTERIGFLVVAGREPEFIEWRETSGAILGDVWDFPASNGLLTKQHAAGFPEALVERILLLASRPGQVVVDPFSGSGTVRSVAHRLGRRFVGGDLDPAMCDLAVAGLSPQPTFPGTSVVVRDRPPSTRYVSEAQLGLFAEEGGGT